MNRRNWAFASFVVGMLALLVGIVAIFANGIMTDEARELAGLKSRHASPTIPPTDQGVVASSPPPTTKPITTPQTPSTTAGTEFTIVEASPTIAPPQPSARTIMPISAAQPVRPNGTRYELARLPRKVDGSVHLVFEEDQ